MSAERWADRLAGELQIALGLLGELSGTDEQQDLADDTVQGGMGVVSIVERRWRHMLRPWRAAWRARAAGPHPG